MPESNLHWLSKLLILQFNSAICWPVCSVAVSCYCKRLQASCPGEVLVLGIVYRTHSHIWTYIIKYLSVLLELSFTLTSLLITVISFVSGFPCPSSRMQLLEMFFAVKCNLALVNVCFMSVNAIMNQIIEFKPFSLIHITLTLIDAQTYQAYFLEVGHLFWVYFNRPCLFLARSDNTARLCLSNLTHSIQVSQFMQTLLS